MRPRKGFSPIKAEEKPGVGKGGETLEFLERID